MFDWLLFGYRLATLIFSTAVSLVCGGLIFKKWLAPVLMGELEKANETVTNLAKLAGVKSQEFTGAKSIEKSVARDMIANKIPELEAVRVFVSQDTWDEIQDTIESNPEAILQLWQKYGHFFGGDAEAQQSTELPDF